MFPINFVSPTQHFDEWAKEHPEIVNRKRKVILRNGQSPGDLLVWSRSISDLATSYPNYQIGIECPAYEIFENSPRITQLDKNDPEVEIFNIGYDEINQSGLQGLHFSDAFRHDMEKKLGVPIKKDGIRPELWISDEEKSWWNQVHCEFGDDSPFILLNAGMKPDNELKFYHRYQEVVDILNDYFQGKVKIVQIGHQDHIHPPLNGVLSLVGKTNIRQLIRLAYWSQMLIGPISFQMVIAAAFEKPGVCIFGGKEGVRWQLFPHIKYLYMNGSLPCCKYDGCWLGGTKGECKNLVETDKGLVPKCFEMIKPYMVADAVKSYYEGGILSLPTDEEHENNERKMKEFKKI